MTEICMLSIIVPVAIEEVMIDWLHEQEEITGFNSIEIFGHGTHEEQMSLYEKVTGKSRRIMYQSHLSEKNARIVLSRLQQDFAKNDIHFMIRPLIAAGNLMSLDKS